MNQTVYPDARIADLLTTLDRSGGTLPLSVLARAINCAPVRARSFLAVMQRLLNIDGYAVLTRDNATETVKLNRDLLCRHFDLSNGK